MIYYFLIKRFCFIKKTSPKGAVPFVPIGSQKPSCTVHFVSVFLLGYQLDIMVVKIVQIVAFLWRW